MNGKTKGNWRLLHTSIIARAKDKNGKKYFNWVQEQPRDPTDPNMHVTSVNQIGAGTTGTGVAWYTFNMPFGFAISIDGSGQFLDAYKLDDPSDCRSVTDIEEQQIDSSIQTAIRYLERIKENDE